MKHVFTIGSLMLFTSTPAFAGFEVVLNNNPANTCRTGDAANYSVKLAAPNDVVSISIPSYGPVGVSLPDGAYANITVNRKQQSLQPTRVFGAQTEWVSVVPETWPVNSYCDWAWVDTSVVGIAKTYALLMPNVAPGTRYEIRYYELVVENGVNKWLLSRKSQLISSNAAKVDVSAP